MRIAVATEKIEVLKAILQTHVELALPSKEIRIKAVALRTEAWEKAPALKKNVLPVAFLVRT